MLSSLVHAGACVKVASVEGEPVGASVAFLHGNRRVLYLHVIGVRSEFRDHRIGLSLMLAQRRWALDRDILTMEWVYDPLVRRNAIFYLGKLGAEACDYIPDFYGRLKDSVNADQGSDRLLVRWELLDPTLDQRLATGGHVSVHPLSPIVLLDRDRVGGPGTPPGIAVTDSGIARIPADVELMRARGPDGARRWRTAFRAVVAHRRVLGATSDGDYVLSCLIPPSRSRCGEMLPLSPPLPQF